MNILRKMSYNRRLELLQQEVVTYCDITGWDFQLLENGCIIKKFPFIVFVEFYNDYSVGVIMKYPLTEKEYKFNTTILFMDWVKGKLSNEIK